MDGFSSVPEHTSLALAVRDGRSPAPSVPDGLELDAGLDRRSRFRSVAVDLREGWRLRRLAVSLGWIDIKLRYRGSVLGPFWLTLSSAVMVAAMGSIYSLLFHQAPRSYLPFLAVSLILWQAGIGALATDACNCFTQAEGTIRAMRMPFSVQVGRTVVAETVVLGHNLVVPLAVFAIFGVWPGWRAALALPGIGLWLLDGAAACFLLGAVCARFRDIPPIVGSVMQIAYYVTPVIWKPEQLGHRGWWLPFNPFFPLLEVVRVPLLGRVPALASWEEALGYSVLLWVAAFVVFARARARIAFWV